MPIIICYLLEASAGTAVAASGRAYMCTAAGIASAIVIIASWGFWLWYCKGTVH